MAFGRKKRRDDADEFEDFDDFDGDSFEDDDFDDGLDDFDEDDSDWDDDDEFEDSDDGEDWDDSEEDYDDEDYDSDDEEYESEWDDGDYYGQRWSDDADRSDGDDGRRRSRWLPVVAVVAIAAVGLVGWRVISSGDDSGSGTSVAEPTADEDSYGADDSDEESTAPESAAESTATESETSTTEAAPEAIEQGASSGKKAADEFAKAYYVERNPARAMFYFNPNGSTSSREMASEINALTGSETRTKVTEAGPDSFKLEVSGVFDGNRQNYDPMTLRVGEFRGKWFVMEVTAGSVV